jgi:iron(III) transport system substrate-binding protein
LGTVELGGDIMSRLRPTRRAVLLGSAAAAGALGWPRVSVRAAPPVPESITAQLIEAARSEGKVIWYTSVDLQVAEAIAKAFEAQFAGVAVRIERTGAERVFQRISQERASNIFACDVAQSSDAAHYIAWKREGALTPCVPEDVAKHFPAQHKDVAGLFASWRIWLCGIAYNTRLVKAQEAPKSFADLLDPKWAGKLVKAHPGYSGTVLTATHQMARDLGWSYFEARQAELNCSRSAQEAALGERGHSRRQRLLITRLKEKGEPVEFVYATEDTLITGLRHHDEPAQPERCAPLPHLVFHGRGAAAQRRCRGPALGACPGQGTAPPYALERHQADAGGCSRGRSHGRGDQGQIHANLPRVSWCHLLRSAHGGRLRMY